MMVDGKHCHIMKQSFSSVFFLIPPFYKYILEQQREEFPNLLRCFFVWLVFKCIGLQSCFAEITAIPTVKVCSNSTNLHSLNVLDLLLQN